MVTTTAKRTPRVSARWVRNEADERAVAAGCRFSETRADRVVEFFRRFLCHSKGKWAGKPFELLPWQRRDVIYPLFGWLRADGTRRYRRAYIEIPKKNGKSTLCAGISLYLLAADNEPGAEVYSAAADRQQAAIVWKEAATMVKHSPHLASRLNPVPSSKSIAYEAKESVYRALSKEPGVQEGLNIHGLIFDELHAQPNSLLWDSLRYGGASRTQPMLVAITTAGFDRNSVCYHQHDYAAKVADGIIEDRAFFGYVRAAGEKDDWRKPSTWRKANPSYGVTVDAVQFAEDFREAKETSHQENTFKRYRLNIWTEQSVRWLPMDKWDACAEAPDLEALAGRRCFAGLDLATTTDLTALVLAFPDEEGGFDLLAHFWAPEENAANRQRRDRVPYLDWARQDLLALTPGNVTDYDFLRVAINDLAAKYVVQEIAIDRLFQGVQLATALKEKDGHKVIAFGQGFYSMAGPSAEFDRLVLDGKLRHGGNPIMRWMASNVAVKTDAAGNIKPDKEKSTERIDGIVAAIMAIGRATVAVEVEEAYKDRGLLVLG